ncbi:MAG: cysteine--tRNA ligase [Bacilli bacterium]|nr:cysteine--tRNA ligase [Bacilli bacterium]
MKLYNTLTKKVEDFSTNEKGIVAMYTCGPTVYHFAHIGNLRTYIFEDILQKSLEYLGYEVKRVMNITDVGHMTSDGDTGEDKMQKGAEREHKTVYEIADFYTKAFMNDIDKLNIKLPGIVEKASDHIDTYIEMIQKLLEKDYAYQAGGNIYFDVSKFPNYYELSGKSGEDLLVGVREDVEEDKSKRNPADFGLWFTLSKFENQVMQWDSPWGRGYPGWHIECSGISYKYLGEYLDIHCGGVDNIFPHHTNEIAQSESFLGHKWCNYWCHGEHLNDNTGKMSKSKGEFLTLSLLESKGYEPLVYRLFCLNSHYRSQLVFSYEAIDATKNAYQKLLGRTAFIRDNRFGEKELDKIEKYEMEFKRALENDLNTANALTTLYDVLKSDCTNETKFCLIESFDRVLSLGLLKEEKLEYELEQYIETQIQKRNEAKKQKQYELADKIRSELLEKGIELKDGREGTTYTIKK